MPITQPLFPDQSHINKVRDALWRRPGAGASVMVGSGFSINAEKTRFDAVDLPLWKDIAKAIIDELYPSDSEGALHRPGAERLSPGSALRFAEEYETAFGRTDLHRLLGELVQDSHYEPGRLHRRLLGLPWRDVFTTNWDTLLERASSEVDERPYSLVHDRDQLPLMSQPRILKLHGSFPSKFPLIVTEEDYRTYPREYAPFVNTVQQAMMETVFLLIGFSGDDPNFLNWSGWIRDNLGKVAPRIYLAGWLQLSNHRRSMLEDRGVVPIDIAQHPKSHSWSADQCHRLSVEWLIHTLERGRPYDFTNWPSPAADDFDQIRDILQPVSKRAENSPIPNHAIKTTGSGSPKKGKELLDTIRDVIVTWQYNRRLYPGWVVFPAGAPRQDFRLETDEWESPILQSLPNMSIRERLTMLSEVVWRRKVLAEPLNEHLASSCKAALDSFQSSESVLDDSVSGTEITGELLEELTSISLALLADARLSTDQEGVDSCLKKLDSLPHKTPEIVNAIIHERCLWAIYSLDFEGLGDLLGSWDIGNCDGVWKLRKAALLNEIGRHAAAREMISVALKTFQQSNMKEPTIASASRESWALASAMTSANHQEINREWDRLAAMKCDAGAEIDQLRRAILRATGPGRSPNFDLGIRRELRFHFEPTRNEPIIAAYRALLLCEASGLAPVNAPSEEFEIPISLMSEILGLAVDELASINIELAIRVLLRICTSDSDKRLGRILSRSRVATIPEHTVNTLASICMDTSNHALSNLSDSKLLLGHHSWRSRLQVSLEVLSRFSLRLPTARQEEVLTLVKELYSSQEIVADVLLGRPLEHLLRRTWQSLSPARRMTHSIDMLRLPLAGFEGFSSEPQCVDPGGVITSGELPRVRTPENESEIAHAIDYSMRALHAGSVTKTSALMRLFSFSEADLLTGAESIQMAGILWENSDPVIDIESRGRVTFDWLFLVLPELTPGQAEESFRRKWLKYSLSADGDDINESARILSEVGAAVSALRSRGRQLILSSDDEQCILKHILNIEESLEGPAVSFAPIELAGAIVHIGSLAIEIKIPTSTAESLLRTIEAQWARSLQSDDGLSWPAKGLVLEVGFALLPGIARALPGEIDSIVDLLENALASGDADHTNCALTTIRSWVERSADRVLEPLPDDLLVSVANIIASTNRTGLAHALLCMTSVFDVGTAANRAAVTRLVLSGLSRLTDSLTYVFDDGEDTTFDVDGEDMATLRVLCVQLALQMEVTGYSDHPAVAKWLKAGKIDPLPEVRHLILKDSNLA